MKNILEIDFQLTSTKIFFCYGQKSLNKLAQERYSLDDLEIPKSGTVLELNKKDEFAEYILTVREYDDIYAVKALIVHEISHLVTMLMKEFGFTCDEFRSYSMQFLYTEIIIFLDELIRTKKQKEKE